MKMETYSIPGKVESLANKNKLANKFSYHLTLYFTLKSNKRYYRHVYKLDMSLWNTDASGGNKVKLWQKSLSYILTSSHPQGHVMSVKCEQPLDELTVQVWLLYDHPNFKYCTLFKSRTELWTDEWIDKRTDDPSTRCPWRIFQARGIKNFNATLPNLSEYDSPSALTFDLLTWISIGIINITKTIYILILKFLR